MQAAAAVARREEVHMSVANAGPAPWEPLGRGVEEAPRRTNPSLVHRIDRADDMWAASTRASTVSHRFGAVRHALTRKGSEGRFAAGEGDSDAGQ